METVPKEDWGVAFTAVAREWLSETGRSLGPQYRLHESSNFLLLGVHSEETATRLLVFLETARRRILAALLPGIAAVEGHGKHAAILFDSRRRYYSYISYYYPQGGEYAASGGVYVECSPNRNSRWGYGHFALHGNALPEVERTVAHELTHNCLRHLPLPSWLNEGLASTVEAVVMEDPAFVVRGEDLNDHCAHWNGGRIQEFWAGQAVHLPDDGSRLTYHLARMAVRVLSSDFDRFREFVLHANREDGGEAAFRKVYGRGLGDLIGHLLGPGKWAPEPHKWRTESGGSAKGSSRTNV